MQYVEVLQFIGGLFGCWLLGWGSAFVIKIIKQFSEKI